MKRLVTFTNELVIDGHNDSIVAMIRSGNRNIDGTLKPNWHEHEGAVAYLRQYYADPEQKLLQLDLRKMKKGELDAFLCRWLCPLMV